MLSIIILGAVFAVVLAVVIYIATQQRKKVLAKRISQIPSDGEVQKKVSVEEMEAYVEKFKGQYTRDQLYREFQAVGAEKEMIDRVLDGKVRASADED